MRLCLLEQFWIWWGRKQFVFLISIYQSIHPSLSFLK
jgi:hypothetical protein